ncbi:MAG: type II toxin-antitoxin system ParD family antitoxin [Flavobacteriaceae bacterium]|nr:type II toxin-antitoxin system ParD family antitoxin [Flavobacteriaceae bacterium]
METKKMAKTTKKKTSITLNNYYLNIIKRELKIGRYDSINQVVMSGLRSLEKEEYKSETKRKNRIKKQKSEKNKK